MTTLSLVFFAFSFLVLLVYYRLNLRAQNFLLLLASYAFYLTWSWSFALVLLVLTAVNYALGGKLEKGRPRRKLWLSLGVGVDLGALIFFRTAHFFVPGLIKLLAPLGLPLEGLKILLPIGLSFYVLQAIAYLVDVSRGQAQASGNVIDFALALAYFPKLTAGPIERLREFIPKLGQPRVVDNSSLARALTLLVIGLVRKIVVADTLLNAIPGDLMTRPDAYSSVELILWMIAFVFGLYSDFAGYTDIVRGVSGLFGIELSRNFAFPLFSRNFSEFWSRWHITLSNWLKDYIFFPLSRALVRRNEGRWDAAALVLPAVVTMVASGMWHGTGWNFVLWGLALGIFLVVERIPSLWRPILSPEKRPWPRRYLGTALVWTFAILAAVLFRTSVPSAIVFWKKLFSFSRLTLPDSRVYLVILPALWIDWVQYRRKNEWAFLAWPRLAQAALLAAAAVALILFSQAQVGEPFIYQGF